MAENYSVLDLAPGNVVGGYTLLDRLDRGGMGAIWRVRDDGGAIYAMKILLDSFEEDNDDSPESDHFTARERFRREALALQRIHHPGVNRIVDMELDDAVAFIVTELIEGKNLRDDVYENGRYTAQDLEQLARMLIDAVDAVHAAGIIHRDIKPTNVMISRTGPILVDFGIAMGENESHMTRTGLVMGTPGFIAPEIIEGAESDEATDWWSVASVIGFAATGKPIFGSQPMMTVLERAASGNADLVGLPPLTLRRMQQALNPDRMQRCSAQELLTAISEEALTPDIWDNGDDNLLTSQTTVLSTSNSDNSYNQAQKGVEKTSVMPPFSRSFSHEETSEEWNSHTTRLIDNSSLEDHHPSETPSTTLMPAMSTDGVSSTAEDILPTAAMGYHDDNIDAIDTARDTDNVPNFSEESSLPISAMGEDQPAPLKKTFLYWLGIGILITSIGIYFPAVAMLFFALAVFLFALRGSRIETRYNNPHIAKSSLILSWPWHIVKAFLTSALYAFCSILIMAIVNIGGIFIARLGNNVVAWGNWPHIFLYINGCALLISWIVLCTRPQAYTLRTGLYTQAPSSTQKKILRIGLWCAGFMMTVILSLIVHTIIWWPLPDIQTLFLTKLTFLI